MWLVDLLQVERLNDQVVQNRPNRKKKVGQKETLGTNRTSVRIILLQLHDLLTRQGTTQ